MLSSRHTEKNVVKQIAAENCDSICTWQLGAKKGGSGPLFRRPGGPTAVGPAALLGGVTRPVAEVLHGRIRYVRRAMPRMPASSSWNGTGWTAASGGTAHHPQPPPPSHVQPNSAGAFANNHNHQNRQLPLKTAIKIHPYAKLKVKYC